MEQNRDRQNQIKQRIAAFPYWYHSIELVDGIVTPGDCYFNPANYGVPDDLTDKRVLDVGAWDGFWTFEALKRGAREVVAIDDFQHVHASSRSNWGTFDLCREVLGYSPQACQRLELSVYDVSEARLGRFDIIFFFGVLYHLRYPLLALDRLSAICDQQIYVESAILDDYSPYRGGIGQGYSGEQVVMEFYPHTEYGGDFTNRWVPTLQCLVQMIHSSGFESVRYWKRFLQPTELAQCRGCAIGTKAAFNSTQKQSE